LAKKTDNRTGSLGFEAKLWAAADLLRSNMDPAEYKHVVLGLLFIKYISDAFEERREELSGEVAEPKSEYYFKDQEKRQTELSELLDDRDEFTAENIFWVPPEARWSSRRRLEPSSSSATRLCFGFIVIAPHLHPPYTVSWRGQCRQPR